MSYLRQIVERPPVLSNLDPIPNSLGVAGAHLGLKDNQTTGAFMGQEFALEVIDVQPGEDLLAAAQQAFGHSSVVILDMPAAEILRVADMDSAQGALLINATAPATSLRDENCRANVLHTMPSRAMLADGMMQFAVKRRWDKLALIEGVYENDRAWAEALRKSATKFGVRIRGEKTWAFDADMRRNAAQEVPLFTQDLPDHDMLLIADENGDFGRYIAYNTWEPRPIAGSEGLRPVAWSRVAEQWGAVQMQNRFVEANERGMRAEDFGSYAALRAIGEAVTRTESADPAVLRSYLLSDEFELAAFKGRPLSFRAWNGQLRQPILLVTERAVVATAPLEGFLHPVSEMDTLGLDQPESNCTVFEGK
ncbi:MAG: ABC transporter substrate-binding protein [Maritimibacter sp.]